MKKTLFISIVMLFWTVSMAFAENVSVKVSQKSVTMNDSFSVIFSTHQNIKEQPDFSPLKADFDILSSSQEFSTSIINSAVTQQTRWKLVLMGKREGDVVIPSIQFGQSASPPQSIEVREASSVKQDEAIFLETELSPVDSAYVQTVLMYTIRLYTSMPISQAFISELEVNDPEAMIEQLGGDAEFEHYSKNGKHYKIIERRYTVIPQRSGELVFSPVIFEGKVVTGRHSFFDFQTQFKRLTSEQHTIEINPIPPQFQRNNWLGANGVKLSEEWSGDLSKMIVGEPITWTLKIEADGALGTQIPDIALNLPDTLKHYLDKPEIATEEGANGVRGVKQIKVALIGTKPGDFELPEIVLKWWDLKADQPREEILPRKLVHIEPDVVAMVESPLAVLDQRNDSVDLHSRELQPTLGEPSQALPLWVWLLVGINGLLIASLSVFLCKKMLVKRIKPDSLSQLKASLKKACQANDAKQTAAYFLEWAAVVFPGVQPLNIVTIKAHVPQEMQEALDDLYRVLYGDVSNWSGEALWESVNAFKPTKTKKKKKLEHSKVLQDLYPTH